MVKNTEIVGSATTNPYHFHHFDLSSFVLNVNGIDNEETSVMGCRTLFDCSGIQHSNSGIQVTHDMYINSYFILLLDLKPDLTTSERHTSHSGNGIIREELKFGEPLPEPITCIFYLVYDNSVRVHTSRTVTTYF